MHKETVSAFANMINARNYLEASYLRALPFGERKPDPSGETPLARTPNPVAEAGSWHAS